MKDTITLKVSSLVSFLLILLLVFVGGTVIYGSHIQKQNQAYTDGQNHKWCALIDILLPAYQKAAADPKTVNVGTVKQLATDFSDLSRSYGC